MFWAFTMVLWHQIMGRLFIPFGAYFAGLVSPAFNPIAKGDGTISTPRRWASW